jgi:hypothetical protein
MRRRRLLTVLGAIGGTSLLSGCADRVSVGSGSESGPDAGAAANASSGSAASASVSATTGTDVAASGDCPAVGPSVVCYQDASEDAPVVLVPSVASASLAGEAIGFSLYNRSGSEIAFRPYDWRVWQYADRWVRIDGDGDGNRPSVGETTLSPGGSYAWQVAVGPIEVTADRPPVTVNSVEFDVGRYAFGVPARREKRHTYAAAFDVTE